MAPHTSARVWNILVVDDEADVHNVTQLGLKRRQWRQRPFEITSCFTSIEARELVRTDRRRQFDVAIVDVVMETQHAGLDLCRYLRTELPSSLRIILRTGQPGAAPEEKILNEYDIDQYLAKSEVTPERLYAAIRTCLRSSQDIETLLAFHQQLRNFSSALPSISTDPDLLLFMQQGLSFLEPKHQVRITFVRNIEDEPARSSLRARYETVARGHAAELTLGKLLPADALGAENACVLIFAVPAETANAAAEVVDTGGPRRADALRKMVRGGMLIEGVEPYMIDTLQADLTVFVRNWTTAHGALLLQQRVTRDKMLSEAMYLQRTDRLGAWVAAVVRDLKTPLVQLDEAKGKMGFVIAEGKSASSEALVTKLRDPMSIIDKSATTVRECVRSFEEHLLTQLSDDRVAADVVKVVNDCLQVMRADAVRQEVEIRATFPERVRFPWTGVPGDLAQVLSNLIQNSLRYAYRGKGTIDVRLAHDGDKYKVEVEDYGNGIPNDVVAKMFDPPAPTEQRRLGLPIAYHIVTRLLRGRISCQTEAGKGTKFVVTLPRST